MELELRDYSSGDVQDIWNWSPLSTKDVFFQLTIEIGESGKKGGHLFQLVVATPEGLREFTKKHPGHEFPDRALLVFSEYTFDSLTKRIGKILSHCSRDTWDKSIGCLRRYFDWEYEDYN